MLKPFVLVMYLLSTGLYSETFATVEDCEDALVEASLLLGGDIYTGDCFDREDWKPGASVNVMLP